MAATGRNEPCPCGSGKKYKKCCLDKVWTPSQEGRSFPGSFTPEDRASAIQKLTAFASRPEFREDNEIAASLYWGGRLADRTDEEIDEIMNLPQTGINFNVWFLLDMDLEEGRAIADFFLERNRDRLTPGERGYLEKAVRTHFRLYEVEEVERDKGFRLKDLWTGKSCQVRERSATHGLAQWDLLATRLMDKGDHHEIDAGIFNYPQSLKRALLKELKAEHKQFQRNLPGRDDTAFFKRAGILFNHWWLDEVVFRPLPEIRTPEGDEFVVTRVVFDLKDRARVTAALEDRPEFDRTEKGEFAWVEETPDRRRNLGTIELREDRLILETMSAERGERGRRLLEAIAGEAVRFRMTEYQEVEQALKTMPKTRDPRLAEILPEVEAQILKEFLDKHYRKWLDEKIPALSNKTPRHAVKLKTFRPRVIDLLKQMENMEAHAAREGRLPYDFGWLWKELGLKGER